VQHLPISVPAQCRDAGAPRQGLGAGGGVEQQAGLVGIDSLNIDDTSHPSRPVHTALLAAGIPIVEHLCGLDQLPPSGFRFHAAPPQVVGIGTFPVRAYAVLADG
jgi:kynurenine formamidase